MFTRIVLIRAQLLLAIAGATCVACVAKKAPSHVAPEPALAVEISRVLPTGIGYGCLPRTGDSTRFEVVVVVDSLGVLNNDDVTIVRNIRGGPRAGYSSNQGVTVEIQRAGQSRIAGTVCWHDAGIVLRGSHAVLNHASIAVNAPVAVLVRILDDRGRAVSDSVWSTLQGRSQRVAWMRR